MLKGEVKIDLIDEKTGKIETYQDTNMVTNLVSDIFTYNPFQFHLRNYLSYFNQSSFSDNFTPIIPKIINGVILFDGDLDDDPDNYFQNNELGITAYANKNIHTSLDPKRGNPNLAEQTDLSNGYKFVYEFNTSQGNGIIKSLGLTSAQAGAWGHGSTYYNDCQDTKVVEHYKINETYSFSEDLRRLNSMTSIDPENNCGYFVRCNSQGKIEVGTIRIPFSNIKLKEYFQIFLHIQLKVK